ncbi:MAG TPA: formylmethanofuran dehydrogenase subunit E family protein, partial [Candidatus Dormibacteraeota bacterium]|nr:formylmethanofuran dehydrogenase subunit E family protein [Candidatus Dormibacteraeota bacterium]
MPDVKHPNPPQAIAQNQAAHARVQIRPIITKHPKMKTLDQYLEDAPVAHGHICAGQVLGVRLAMLGLRELGIEDPIRERKRIVTYVEIDRCMTDAVALVANCRLGK